MCWNTSSGQVLVLGELSSSTNFDYQPSSYIFNFELCWMNIYIRNLLNGVEELELDAVAVTLVTDVALVFRDQIVRDYTDKPWPHSTRMIILLQPWATRPCAQSLSATSSCVKCQRTEEYSSLWLFFKLRPVLRIDMFRRGMWAWVQPQWYSQVDCCVIGRLFKLT